MELPPAVNAAPASGAVRSAIVDDATVVAEPSAAEMARMTDEAVFGASTTCKLVVKQMMSAGWELGLIAGLGLARHFARVLDQPELVAKLRDAPDAVGRNPKAEDPLQSALADKSAAGPTRRRYLDEIRGFLPYAVAAYALTRDDVVAVLRTQGIEAVEEDILFATLVDSPLVPAHMVMRDTARRAIVISIRGTSSIRDIVRDAAATSTNFAGGAMAHTGMSACVDGLTHYQVPAFRRRTVATTCGCHPHCRHSLWGRFGLWYLHCCLSTHGASLPGSVFAPSANGNIRCRRRR